MRRRDAERPPLQEALPEEFRLQNAPEVDESEHAAYDDWSARRHAWARAHGYSGLELLRSDVPRPTPMERKKHRRRSR